MEKFTCRNFRGVSAESITDAARIFALRHARRCYGSSADVRTCTMGSYAQNGSCAEFSAFVGITRGSETTGHNISFTVHRA